jgi:hypothetical protein
VFAIAFLFHAGLSNRWVEGIPTPVLRRAQWSLAPVLLALAGCVLGAPLHLESYATRIFGVLHGYHHAVVHQLYELRYLPVVAIILLVASGAGIGTRTGRPIAMGLLSGAVGALGFSLFRLFLVAVFAENLLWFSVWEELLEFVSIAALFGILSSLGRLFAPRRDELPAKEPSA